MAGANLKEELDVAKLRVVTLISSAPRGGPPAKNLAQRYLHALADNPKVALLLLVNTPVHLFSNVRRWIQFVDAANNGTVQATEEAYIRFVMSLDEMQFVRRKVAASQAVHKRELEGFERKKQELADNVAQAKARIEDRKQELAAARQWRQQQEEYELLRKQIMEVAPRHETQQQIDEANRQIDSIRADVVRQGQTYQLIAKKCAAVRYQVEDLLASFPKADGPAGDAAAEAAQPMQIDG
eukprot:gene2790-3084_t